MGSREHWESQVRAVPWASLSDEPSDATLVESLLLKLWDFPVDPNEKAKLYWEIFGLVVDQGATFAISIAVARLLVAFVAEESAPYRDLACLLLMRIAIGDEDAELSNRQSMESRRRELARQVALLAHPDDKVTGEQRWDPLVVNDEQTFLAAYDAVRDGVPTYVGLLRSDDPRTRLRASALLGWFPEERGLTIAPLVALIEESGNPWIRATTSVALGMLAEPDDPEVERVLQAAFREGSEPERWSGCIGLAEMLTAPSDEVVDELYDCMGKTRGQTYPWGFLDGNISEFAAYVAAALPRSAAAAQVRALVRRLPSPAPLTEDAVVRMLLSAAIGDDVRKLDSLNYDHLPAPQATALGAIAQMVRRTRNEDHPNLLMLLQSYGVPAPDLYTFVAWTTGRTR